MMSEGNELEESVCIRESENHVKKRSHQLKSHDSIPCKNPASVAKRNARERRRIQNVNKAFDELRQHVPLGGQNRKISKVDTLQSAIEYIKALEQLVRQKRQVEHITDNENGSPPSAICDRIGMNCKVDQTEQGESPNTMTSPNQHYTDQEQFFDEMHNANALAGEWEQFTVADRHTSMVRHMSADVTENVEVDGLGILYGICDGLSICNTSSPFEVEAYADAERVAEWSTKSMEY